MGAYLTQPITEKVSEDKAFKGMTYGASSMQGWRITQEDAHNCITDFDEETDTSLFAVYDGHGGSEVAQYCAQHLPGFIKSLPEYKSGDLGNCSQTAFLQFDATLTDEAVIKELKILAGDDDGGDEDEASAAPCIQSEADMLRAEANMPLDQLLSNYEHLPPGATTRNLRKNEQFCSPMIRSKKVVFDNSEDGPGGSSSSVQDGVSSSDSCNNNASSIVLSLDEKLLTNGHADNENNLNKEKEIQDSLNSKNENNNNADSLSDASESSLVKREELRSISNDAEPSSSTDRIKSPIKQITSEPECSSTVGNSEDHSKSKVSGLSSSSNLSSSSSSVASSSSESVSKIGVSGSCSSSDSGVATSSSSSSQSAGGSGCSSSSGPTESKESASSSSVLGVSASNSSSAGSSSEIGNSAASSSEAGGSSEAGSSGSSSSRNKGPMLCIDDDEDDEDDEDEEYEDMESEEDEEEEEEEEGEEETDGDVDQPYNMDMANEEPGSDSGCTACLALLRGKQLLVANAGDSRCVISRAGVAVELSFDHKPEDELERKRIEKAGGKVTADGRVNGGLNLSRAIGDHWYKRNTDLPAEEQMISASPDIQSVTLGDEDDFIVIACDGIWNYLSSQEVVEFVHERIQSEEKRKKPSIICEEMFDYCLAPNTFGDGTGCDNMTCIIIILNPEKEPTVYHTKRSAEELDTSKTDELQANKKFKIEDVPNSSNNAETVAETVMDVKNEMSPEASITSDSI
ncbi:hypothetical protein SNE40_012355 [Patella caerulea]|uniref:protein-serine/threonine phosphatase n=1 Tax=Patella caerulea TaxID=87958 RepID=A0AAN8JRC1_PATCE